MLFNKFIYESAFVLDSLEVLFDFRGKCDSHVSVLAFLRFLRTAWLALWRGWIRHVLLSFSFDSQLRLLPMLLDVGIH